MTPATDVFFPPVARKEYLDRLAVLPPRSDLTPDLWTEVHEEVQRLLEPLEAEIRRQTADLCVTAGRTRGSQFFLFSYRTFSLPVGDADGVVAGMTFTPAPQGVALEADVSGEQSGDGIFSLPTRLLGNSRHEVLEAAREAARELCRSAAAITAALQDPSRGVE